MQSTYLMGASRHETIYKLWLRSHFNERHQDLCQKLRRSTAQELDLKQPEWSPE